MKFVDIHTHAAWNPESIQIRDLSGLPLESPQMQNYYSMGLHPWFVKQNNFEQELQKIEKLIPDPSFLALGECGLDKVCGTDFMFQIDAFKRQIALSEKYEKPLILHVVKAFNEIIQLRKESKAQQSWIIHGFNGSPQLANQLSDLGMYVSFGAILRNNSSKASRSIQSIPTRKLFLETDDSEFTIDEVYMLASKHLNIDIEQLKNQISFNFQKMFW